MAKYHGKYAYMGAWSYVFLDILYAIPIIGFIFLLIHAFSQSNPNRMHYARSMFARMLLVLIICVLIVGAIYLVVGSDAFMREINAIINEVKRASIY